MDQPRGRGRPKGTFGSRRVRSQHKEELQRMEAERGKEIHAGGQLLRKFFQQSVAMKEER